MGDSKGPDRGVTARESTAEVHLGSRGGGIGFGNSTE